MLELQKYLKLLVCAAENRAVLQFNRIDFRLHWIATHFPECFIIELQRNPRDQWLSTFLLGKPVPPDAKMSSFLMHDEFYLTQWVTDLRKWFPLLREIGSWHPYQVSYLISLMSRRYAHSFADLTITYEDLVTSPVVTLRKIESVTQCEGISASSAINGMDNKSVGRWRSYASEDWFLKCEEVVDQIAEACIFSISVDAQAQ
jgi:hypothetical protein